MKKITVLLLVLIFGFGTFQSFGQDTKQKGNKTKKEVTINTEENKAEKDAKIKEDKLKNDVAVSAEEEKEGQEAKLKEEESK